MSVYLPEFMQKLHAQRADEAASLSRRGFIKLTGLAGGGLVLAVGVAARHAPSARTAERRRVVRRESVRADPARRQDRAVREESRRRPGREDVVADDRRRGARRRLAARRSAPVDHRRGQLRPAVRRRLAVDPDELRVAAPRRRDGARDARRRRGEDLERAGGRAHDAGEHGAPCGQQPQRDVRPARRSRRDVAGARCGQPHAEAEAELPLARHARDGRRQREARARRAVVRHRSARPGHAVRRVRESAGDRRARHVGESRSQSRRCAASRTRSSSRTRAIRSGSILRPRPCCRASRSSRTRPGTRCRRRRRSRCNGTKTQASSDSWTGAVTQAKSLATKPAAQVLGEAGNVDAAFSAGKTVEAFYTYHYVSHADLEPQNCTAWFKGDSIEIWAPTQTPQNAVDAVAALLGLPKDKVTLHQLRGGGGFGRRLANDSVCEAALDLEAGRRHSGQGAVDARGRHGVRLLPAGRLPRAEGRRRQRRQAHRVAEPLHHVHDGRQAAGLGRDDRQDRVPGERARRISAWSQSMIPSKIPTGPWRAPGSNVIAFCIQSFLHECAVAANRDYVDFLVDVMGEPRATSAGPFGGGLHTGRAVNVIKAVAERARLGHARCRRAAGSGSRSTSATRATSPRSPRSASTRARRSRCTRSGSSPTSARS